MIVILKANLIIYTDINFLCDPKKCLRRFHIHMTPPLNYCVGYWYYVLSSSETLASESRPYKFHYRQIENIDQVEPSIPIFTLIGYVCKLVSRFFGVYTVRSLGCLCRSQIT